MIVKNESAVLSRILACAKQFADEIIVVDTGSTDNSKEIAQSYTDKVYHFEWCDNFAKARNFAFEQASCDYQMWLDADDFISAKNISKILELKSQCGTTTDVYMFRYCTYSTDKRLMVSYYRERLLKRTRNFKWQGFVHEVIVPTGVIKYVDIEIEHQKTAKVDTLRNLKLYRKAIKNGYILSPRERYYYARELYQNGYISKAVVNLKKFLQIENTYPPDNLDAYMLLSDCYLLKNNVDKSLQSLLCAMYLHTPTAELCCKIANIFDQLNKKESAVFWYKTALSCPKQIEGFVNEEYANIIPLVSLSKLLYHTDFQQAQAFHNRAKQICPTHPAVIFNDKYFTPCHHCQQQ